MPHLLRGTPEKGLSSVPHVPLPRGSIVVSGLQRSLELLCAPCKLPTGQECKDGSETLGSMREAPSVFSHLSSFPPLAPRSSVGAAAVTGPLNALWGLGRRLRSPLRKVFSSTSPQRYPSNKKATQIFESHGPTGPMHFCLMATTPIFPDLSLCSHLFSSHEPPSLSLSSVPSFRCASIPPARDSFPLLQIPVEHHILPCTNPASPPSSFLEAWP